MMKKFCFFMIALVVAASATAQQLAFPGADGYGKNVTGGRGGKVYYVTRNDDCSDNDLVEGTLRWALRTGDNTPRTVLFNTYGTIYLTSKLKMNHPNVSILGQSAPGGGVCLAGFPLCITADNVIIRYMRFRAGDVPNQSMTGLDLENCRQVIIDHCSMTWSMEECLTAYDTDSTTVQWCIVGEGLYNSKNSKGARSYATQWGGEHSTMHHTLITNSHSRSPRFNGVRSQSNPSGHDLHVDSEFANNVVFNWSGRNSIYGGENASTVADAYNRVYMVNNYYRPGPSTKINTANQRYFVSASGGNLSELGEWYLSGNKFETDSKFAPSSTIWSNEELQKVNADNFYGFVGNNGSRGMNFWSISPSQEVADKAFLTKIPYELSGLKYESADEAYKQVTTKAGASLPRYDEVDQRLLDEAAGRTDPKYAGSSLPSEYGIIDSPDDIKLSEHDTFMAGDEVQTNYPFLGMREGDKWMIDTDGDGLPDDYETEVGLNPKDAMDAASTTSNGYTWLENYMNGIADGTIQKSKYETSDVKVEAGEKPETVTISYDKSDDAVEGSLPEDATVKYGEAYTLPAKNTSLYKEGYTMAGWRSGSNTYAMGATVQTTEDRKLSPVFSQNRLNLNDRPKAVTVVWDFTQEEAPTLEGQGIYVTQAEVGSSAIDVKMAYDGTSLSLPADKGAKVTLSYGTTKESFESEDGESLNAEVRDASKLQKVTLTLPFIQKEDTHVYYTPQLKVGKAFDLVYTPDSAFVADTEWVEVEGGEPRFTTRWCLDPAYDNDESGDNIQGIVVNNSNRILNAYITGTTTLRAFVSGSNTPGDYLVITATPNDGTPAVQTQTVSALTKAGGTEVVLLYLNKEKKYQVSFTSASNLDMMVAALKLYPEEYVNPADADKVLLTTLAQPEVGGSVDRSPAARRYNPGTQVMLTARPAEGYLFENWTNSEGEVLGTSQTLFITVDAEKAITAHFKSYDSFDHIFTGGPYDAEVRTATELLVALGTAKQATERYRIFLYNGTYDLGTLVMTEIPSNVSLIGESMEGVTIVNSPDPATLTSTNRSDATPTLYIPGDDVYIQDVTIKQGIDYGTGQITGQAQAVRARGDRQIFKRVKMLGCQDTYYINKSTIRNYLEDCLIAGDVDFIYGDGTAYLSHCTVYYNNTNGGGYITAPNTPVSNPWGIVISECVIDGPAEGDGKFYLGRPWNDSPAATFVNNTFKILPVPAGWGAMSSRKYLRFHEYGSKDANGELLDLSVRSTAACSPMRGSDAPVITAEKAATYTKEAVMNGNDNWEPWRLSATMSAPQVTVVDGNLSWQAVDDAYCYMIVRNGNVEALTAHTSYDLSHATASDVFTVRAANQMGGFGEASAPVSTTRIQGILESQVEQGEKPLYDLMGRRVLSPLKGRIYIRNGKKIIGR